MICPNCGSDKVRLDEWRDWDVMSRRVWCCECGRMIEADEACAIGCDCPRCHAKQDERKRELRRLLTERGDREGASNL